MSLVNELQEVAESQDILTVLRKAKRVCGKLNRNDILDWIKSEMEGYEGEVPKYRQVECLLYFHGEGIPAGWGFVKSGMFPVHNFPSISLPVRCSLVSFHEAVTSKQQLYLPTSQEIKNVLVSNLSYEELQRTMLYMHVPDVEVKRILQAVRDVVLDWAIKLEQEGVLGEGHSFTDDEKEKAARVQIILGDNAVVGAIGQGSTGDATVSEV